MCICRVVKCFAFSVTGFGQICARWRAVVVNYNKSTNCANMPKTVRLKCSTGVGYGYISRYISFPPIIYPLPRLFILYCGFCNSVLERICYCRLLKFEVLCYTFHSERVSFLFFCAIKF